MAASIRAYQRRRMAETGYQDATRPAKPTVPTYVSQRDGKPGYTRAEKDALKATGRDPKHIYPRGEIDALMAVPPEQQARIVSVAVHSNDDGSNARSALVSSLPRALDDLAPARRAEVEAYAAIRDAANPGGSMDYHPRVSSGQVKDAMPDLQPVTRLRRLQQAIGRTARSILDTALDAEGPELRGTDLRSVAWAARRVGMHMDGGG